MPHCSPLPSGSKDPFDQSPAAMTEAALPSRPIDFVAEPEAQILVRDTAAGCAGELLTAQPHEGPAADVGPELLERDIALLRRGVRVRALYHHSVRPLRPAIAYAQTATGAGAQVRTAARLPGHVIIVDRRVAFLLERDQSSCLLIQEPCTVHYFLQVFEQLWGEAWAFPAASGADDLSQDPKPAILRMLGAGAKDETVARRLGMSVRTCRRHIAEVMSGVAARSRFQAGVLVTRHGLLGPPPEQAETLTAQPRQDARPDFRRDAQRDAG